MSIPTTARAVVKHRGKTPLQVKTQLEQLICEHTRLTLHFEELGVALKHTRRQLGTEVVKGMELEQALRRVYAERDDARAENRRLQDDNRSLREQLLGRDTSRIEDQATEPMRHVGGEFPDDYLNRTRATWSNPLAEVKPLHQAPIATHRIPSRPTELPGETTETMRIIRAVS